MRATADVSDAVGRPIAMDARLKAVWPGAQLAGPAFTLAVPAGDNTSVHEAIATAAAGSVIVVAGGGFGFLGCALMGGNLARQARDRGIAGAVVDGAIRDVDEIAGLGFPVFAAGAVPTRPQRAKAGTLGIAVECGALSVSPEDVVYGDADGVVIVPAAEHASLFTDIPG